MGSACSSTGPNRSNEEAAAEAPSPTSTTTTTAAPSSDIMTSGRSPEFVYRIPQIPPVVHPLAAAASPSQSEKERRLSSSTARSPPSPAYTTAYRDDSPSVSAKLSNGTVRSPNSSQVSTPRNASVTSASVLRVCVDAPLPEPRVVDNIYTSQLDANVATNSATEKQKRISGGITGSGGASSGPVLPSAAGRYAGQLSSADLDDSINEVKP